jgi:hypothetical protein
VKDDTRHEADVFLDRPASLRLPGSQCVPILRGIIVVAQQQVRHVEMAIGHVVVGRTE